MQKYLLGILTGLLISGLAVIVLFFAALRLGTRPAPIPSNAVLVLRLEGEIPEKAPVEAPFPILESQTPLTLLENYKLIRRAASDPRIKGIILEPRGMSVGWAKVEELRTSLAEFRKSGKPLVAFLRSPGNAEYYLATACDRIYTAPEDNVNLKGLRLELLYLKGTLDKVGVGVDVISAGKYKDGGDIFTRTGARPETLQVMNQLLDQFYGTLVATIAQGRGKKAEDVRALIDNGPYNANAALQAGLVDQLAFEDQVQGDVENRAKAGRLSRLSGREYVKGGGEAGGGTRVAYLVGEGAITRGGGSDGITSGAMDRLLREVRDDASIKGVILRIDSPGGDGIASDDILFDVTELSKRKPVVISMSDVAASGGYFIAMNGSPIVAYPNTLTGSIGVYLTRPNLRGFYDKIGLQKEILSRGKYARIDSEYAPPTPEETEKLRQEVEVFYRAFVSRVARGRNRPYEQVEPLAQGRVWLGSQAKENGLIDELGGIDRAVELLRGKAGLSATDAIQLVPYPERKSFFELLMQRSDEASILGKTVRALAGDRAAELLTIHGVVRMMPYRIEIQ